MYFVIICLFQVYYVLQGGDTENGITLYTEEFKAAIEGFTPASIRNVSLHTAGELGWDDVGGLEDIRSILVETLQWPSKVCILQY